MLQNNTRKRIRHICIYERFLRSHVTKARCRKVSNKYQLTFIKTEPNSVLSTLHVSTHFILTTKLEIVVLPASYFRDEETKVQRDSVAFPRLHK